MVVVYQAEQFGGMDLNRAFLEQGFFGAGDFHPAGLGGRLPDESDDERDSQESGCGCVAPAGLCFQSPCSPKICSSCSPPQNMNRAIKTTPTITTP